MPYSDYQATNFNFFITVPNNAGSVTIFFTVPYNAYPCIYYNALAVANNATLVFMLPKRYLYKIARSAMGALAYMTDSRGKVHLPPEK